MSETEFARARLSSRDGLVAISPIGVFLVCYLVVSLIVGDFYRMPISVALLLASVWAVIVSRGKLQDRVEVFSRAAASADVLYMVWIFILAGAFAALAKGIGAIDATVGLTLQYLPPRFVVPGLFMAACFVSFSIGTSVGTVVALTPLAVDMAVAGGGSVPFFVAVVLGGAFFGDNLSFISDTTIAATRTQGCRMADKFRANLWIAVPAALVTLVLYILMGGEVGEVVVADVERPWLILPYLVIIGCAVAGVNVILVLTLGILSASVVGILSGGSLLGIAAMMGEGVDSMGNLIIITLLAAGMLGLIKANGGIRYILQSLTSHIGGRRGAQAGIGLLVGIVNMCTANNTVAIITVGSISKSLAGRYGVDPRKSASVLDTCSCIVQCIIPYGAQSLLAATLAGVSPVAAWPYLYYPWALGVMVVLCILFDIPRYHKRRD